MNNLKLTRKIIGMIIAIFSVSSCSNLPVSHYVQRGEKTYEIYVKGPKNIVGELFHVTAYRVCKNHHKLGFDFSMPYHVSNKYQHGLLKCVGKVDSFLDKIYAQKALSLEELASNLFFHGGFKLNIGNENLEENGMRVR